MLAGIKTISGDVILDTQRCDRDNRGLREPQAVLDLDLSLLSLSFRTELLLVRDGGGQFCLLEKELVCSRLTWLNTSGLALAVFFLKCEILWSRGGLTRLQVLKKPQVSAQFQQIQPCLTLLALCDVLEDTFVH